MGSKTQKECIKKASEIAKSREMDASAKKEKELHLNAEKTMKDKEKARPTMVKKERKQSVDSEEEKAKEVEKPSWNNDQQKQMENGMKTVPASVPTKERWV